MRVRTLTCGLAVPTTAVIPIGSSHPCTRSVKCLFSTLGNCAVLVIMNSPRENMFMIVEQGYRFVVLPGGSASPPPNNCCVTARPRSPPNFNSVIPNTLGTPRIASTRLRSVDSPGVEGARLYVRWGHHSPGTVDELGPTGASVGVLSAKRDA